LTSTDSPAQSPNRTFPGSRAVSTLVQSRVPSTSGQAAGDSMSPASMVGGLPPFAGTSPNDFPYQHLYDRFPFSGAETHSATAIRG
jgi:hypothetical protein